MCRRAVSAVGCKKCCVSMALMKRSLSKSAWRTGRTLIPAGGFTDGRATSANTLREWRIPNSRQSRIPLRTYWTRLRTRNLTLEELQNPEDTAHARIYDRLIEMCSPVCITGENFWKAKAREKMEQLKTLLNRKESL